MAAEKVGTFVGQGGCQDGNRAKDGIPACCQIDSDMIARWRAPTSQHPEQQFLSQLAQAATAVPGREAVLVLGDFNSRVDTASRTGQSHGCRLGSCRVGGAHASGEQLLRMCSEVGLFVGNSLTLSATAPHTHTWVNPRGHSSAVSDYILTGLATSPAFRMRSCTGTAACWRQLPASYLTMTCWKAHSNTKLQGGVLVAAAPRLAVELLENPR